jgi:hypothetical protein
MSFIIKVEDLQTGNLYLNVETGWEEKEYNATHFQIETHADAVLGAWEKTKRVDACGFVYHLKDVFTHGSLSVTDEPEYAVVTSSDEHGYGVFSWHIIKQQAIHNAQVTDGIVVPVDYVNGELIIPPLAVKQAMKGLDAISRRS